MKKCIFSFFFFSIVFALPVVGLAVQGLNEECYPSDSNLRCGTGLQCWGATYDDANDRRSLGKCVVDKNSVVTQVCQSCSGVGTQGTCGSGLVCVGGPEKKEGYCQYADANKIALCNPLKSKTLGDLIGTIENFIFNVAIVLTPILILYAGFLFLTAAGNPAKVTQARSILIWTVVGLAVILLSKGITAIIQGILGI